MGGIGRWWWFEDLMEGNLDCQTLLTLLMRKHYQVTHCSLSKHWKNTMKGMEKEQEGNSSHMSHMQLSLWRMEEMSQVEITFLSVKEDMIWIIGDSLMIWHWRNEAKPWKRRNYAMVATNQWLLNTIQRAAKNKGSVYFAT